jgi:hypothetical protein
MAKLTTGLSFDVAKLRFDGNVIDLHVDLPS